MHFNFFSTFFLTDTFSYFFSSANRVKLYFLQMIMTLKGQHKTKHTWNKSIKQIFTLSCRFFPISSQILCQLPNLCPNKLLTPLLPIFLSTSSAAKITKTATSVLLGPHCRSKTLFLQEIMRRRQVVMGTRSSWGDSDYTQKEKFSHGNQL